MTVLVGHLPGTDPDAAVSLGARLARVIGGPLVVCTVSPPGHDETPEATPEIDGVEVEVEHIEDRSVPGGLARAAHARQADLVVLGDGPPRPGSVGARLARAADVPVALAGHVALADGAVTRVTCAFGPGRRAHSVLATAADLARRADAALRVASFAPQRGPTVPPEAGLHAERVVVEQWREQMIGAQREALEGLGIAGAETVAVADETVEEAVRSLEWGEGDLLVAGASAAGAATRLLIGDPGAAVLEASPVPIVLSPGATAL